MPKACVFVDGENFRHSICDAFTDAEFDKREYLPKGADWAGFFDWLIEQACGVDYERLRTYWYVLESADFFPYKLPDARAETDSLRITLSKYSPFKETINGLPQEQAIDWMAEKAGELRQEQQRFLSRFRGWHVLQDGIANKHRAVEFRRAGSTTYNLFYKTMGQEKAVDVMLATDLITLSDIYDTAIIVSGDQDYVPAVKCVKNRGKTVINVAFKTRKGKLLPGGARRLNVATDTSFSVPHKRLAEFLSIDIERA